LAMPKPLLFRQMSISDVKTMARAPSTFKQGDITRAVKGAFAAGAQSVRVEVGADGQIIVIAGKSATVPTDANASETSEDVKRLL
jgi:hypothetical protein